MTDHNLGKIRNRLRIVLAEKEVMDGRKYTLEEIKQATGIAISTLVDWKKGNVKNLNVETLAALCFFFECKPGDLIEYVPQTLDVIT